MTDKERSRRFSRALIAGAVPAALFVLAALCWTSLSTDSKAGLVLVFLPFVAVGIFLFFFVVVWALSEMVATVRNHLSMRALVRRLVLPAMLLLGCGFIAIEIAVSAVRLYVRVNDASSPRSSPARLRQLYESALGSDDNDLMMHLAGNPNTPSDLLERLASDQYLSVRGRVALNPNTPARVLRGLARDPDPDVRRWLTGNPSCPREVLISLQRDPNDPVRADARYYSRQRGIRVLE